MKKNIEYNVTYNLASILNNAIRTKSDVIILLLNTVSMMLSEIKAEDKNLGTFSVNISKMSRIFFSSKYEENMYKKNFSFCFPFSIRANDEEDIWIYSTVSKIHINKFIIRILIGLAEEGFFNEREYNSNIFDEMDSICSVIASNIEDEYMLDPEIENTIWTIVKELFLFEPGYIRYDCDEERAHAELHPLHHIDIFYSSQVTFKIGLKEKLIRDIVLNRKEFLNVLDISTPCFYLDKL